MRIVLQCWGFARTGGTEIATRELAESLARRGHEVHVVTSRDAGMPRDSSQRGYYVHRVRCIGIRYLHNPSFWISALPCIRRIAPEVIHVQGFFAGIGGLLAKRAMGVPYVVCSQGGDVNTEWPLGGLLKKWLMQDADVVIALTCDQKRKLLAIHDRDVEVVPNGVNMSGFNHLPAKREARAQLGLPEGGPVVLYVGRLVPIKGVQCLVRAMDVVTKTFSNARLVIVGAGEEQPRLESLVQLMGLSGNVEFCGEVPNWRVPLYLAAADVFVLPSLAEGFPIVLAEAMAAGVPIITTNVTGLGEIVADGRNGFLVNPEDELALSERLLALLGSLDLRETMSTNNKQDSSAYDWDRIAERLEKVYQRIAVVGHVHPEQ